MYSFHESLVSLSSTITFPDVPFALPFEKFHLDNQSFKSYQSHSSHMHIPSVSLIIITMAMVDVDDSCQFSADSQPKLIGLFRGLAAQRRSVYIH